MSSIDASLDSPLRSLSELRDVFTSWESKKKLVGTEMEKPGVFADGSVVPYEGKASIRSILEELVKRNGFTVESEHEGGPIIALKRKDESVTLEPGGQLELSGAPLATIHETHAELERHLREVEAISAPLGITWLALGFHPFARREEFDWVPKDRYALMRSYLPTRGAHALDMMLRTSTVQANFDFESEADAMKKLRVSLRLSPLVTAMFANSPWKERTADGTRSHRARTWLDVDPDRSGLVQAVWKPNARYDDYVEWALDIPMFLIKRADRSLANTGQTFRAFFADGFQGEKATFADFQLHLNTLFPEVRLKRTLEVRGADSQTLPLAVALSAFWTGLLYDDEALDRADAMSREWTFDEVEGVRGAVANHALRATFRGAPLADKARELLAISELGLERRKCLDARGVSEAVYLAPLRALTEKGDSPADELLRRIDERVGAPLKPKEVIREAVLLA